MTAYTYIEIACDTDDCPRQEDAAGPYPSLSEARRELIREGWSWAAHEHHCPQHRRQSSNEGEGL